jgi:hypothetical protein
MDRSEVVFSKWSRNWQMQPEQMDAIEEMWNSGITNAAEIHRRLDAPDVAYKTVQRFIHLEMKSVDTSGPWSFSDCDDPTGARHVFEVLNHLRNRYGDGVVSITRMEADFVIRIRSAFPEMAPGDAFSFARRYIRQSEGDTRHIDRAMAAWQFGTDKDSFKETLVQFVQRQVEENDDE